VRQKDRTVLVAKFRREKFRDFGEPVGIKDEFILYVGDTYPIIRMFFKLTDEQGEVVELETFLDIEAEDDMHSLEEFKLVEGVEVEFFDEKAKHQFTRYVPFSKKHDESLTMLVESAQSELMKIPEDERSFDEAKTQFMSKYLAVVQPPGESDDDLPR